MAKRKYYIPLRDDDFYNFQGKLVDMVVAHAAAWNIPPAEVTALTNRRTVYEPLYKKSQEKRDRTSAEVLAHRQMRETYEEEIRVFAKAYLMFNPLVTDDQRRQMNLTVRDTEPSPHPVITDVPYVALRTIGGGEIEVRARPTRDTARVSMLPSANLIEYRYTILEVGDIPPADAEDYPKKDVSSRAKFIITLNTKNTGKKFWTVFRWVNTAKPKQEGPWTDAINITIA